MSRVLLLAILLASCNTYNESLIPGLSSVCLWASQGSVDGPVNDDPTVDCYRVTAPEHARVSPVDLSPCDAAELGLQTVTVSKGERVWMYSEPDLDGTEMFRSRAVACGE